MKEKENKALSRHQQLSIKEHIIATASLSCLFQRGRIEGKERHTERKMKSAKSRAQGKIISIM